MDVVDFRKHSRPKRISEMISTSCDIKEFLAALEGKDYSEIIRLADQEALEAARLFYRKTEPSDQGYEKIDRYRIDLEDFIAYLRSSVRPENPKGEMLKLFRSVQTKLQKRESLKHALPT